MGVCPGGQCCKTTCCTIVITTVTTTPAPTCESFTCPDGYDKKKDTVCTSGECNKATCCSVIVTTVTTTPTPTTKNPCDVVLDRKYDAKESFLSKDAALSKKDAGATPAWVLPFFGVVAMFS